VVKVVNEPLDNVDVIVVSAAVVEGPPSGAFAAWLVSAASLVVGAGGLGSAGGDVAESYAVECE
jgi:hypothetical protein